MSAKQKGGSKNDSSDKHTQALRDLQARCAENKLCFECRQRGPTYVDVTIGSFVCSKCSGVLRGITPPHRIKSISMSSFSTEEVESIRTRGNSYNAKVWLGLYDFKARAAVDTKDDDSVRELIVQKYEKKRFYVDPSCIRHTVEPTPEPSKNQNGPLHSPPSKFSSGLIGSTLQLHQQNKNSATKTMAATPPAAAPVKMTPPPSSAEKPPAVFPSSVNLSKPAVVSTPPPITHQKTPDPFGGIQTTSNVDFFAAKAANDSFANFDSANIYTSPTSNPMTATHSAQMDFGFPPMALPVAPVVAIVEPTPAKQAVSKPIMSSQQQQQEDRYAALKDLDNIFKTSVELTSKSSSDSEQHTKQPSVGIPSNRGTYNPFATDFNSTQQLNTSPWPISASPSGPGFAAPSVGIGSGQGKVPDFFASPWDTPSAAPSASTSGIAANSTDFFNTKGFSNPWSENHENDNKPLPAFGQFGFNKKNPFL